MQMAYAKESENVVDNVIHAGYSKLPTQKVTTIQPPECKHAKTAFLSIKYYDIEGNEFPICVNMPRSLSKCKDVIVTSKGGIVSSADRKKPWIDIYEENHKGIPICQICNEIQGLCTNCLMEEELETVKQVSMYGKITMQYYYC